MTELRTGERGYASFWPHLVWFAAPLFLLTAGASVGREHGFSSSVRCDTRCELDELDCVFTLGSRDLFGDTWEILQASAVAVTAAGEIRIPPMGNLEIIAVGGNTTATVGGSLPVRIGPAGTTLSGLPGLPTPGEVSFAITGYQILPDDPEILIVFGRTIQRDLCDDPKTPPDCTRRMILSTVAAGALIHHPEIRLERNASVLQVCQGVPTDVTYTYTVTNPGNVPLDVQLADDAPCDFPTFTGGDENGTSLLDPGEIWSYECIRTVDGDIMTTATVVGETGLPGCTVSDDRELTITSISPCAGDIDSNCIVDVADIIRLLAAWGACGTCPEDLDGSGTVDVADVITLLAAWGPCR